MDASRSAPCSVTLAVIFIPPPGLTSWPPVESWTEREWTCWLSQHSYTPEQIANYLNRDRFLYGVGLTPTGQRATPQNAYEKGVKWLYQPTPKGVTLHATRDGTISNFLWGGAVGGTKSISALWEAIQICLFPEREDIRVIIVRRELEELRRTHLDKLDQAADAICTALGDPKAIKVTTQPACATFLHTGAKVIGGHALNRGDERKYLSEHYDLFIGDEATELLWEQIVGIQGRLRNDPKRNKKARMMLTTNPGGPSHLECVRHFITKDITKAENPTYDPADYAFIKASLYDNPYYMSQHGDFLEYEKRLWLHTEARRKQLLEGDWSAVVGQFFESFDPQLHVRAIA
jgi:hypothetical protein